MILGVLAALAGPAPAGCPPLESLGLDPGAYELEYAAVDGVRSERGKAIEEAGRIARERLAGRLQGGLPDLARLTLERRIGVKGLDPVAKGGARELVCAVAFVEAEFLDQVRHDAKAVDLTVAGIVAGVVPRVGQAPVFVVPAQTTDGCAAPTLGRALTARLRSVLASAGVATTPSAVGAWRLLVELNPDDAAGVVVSASLWPPGAPASVPLPGAGFTANPWVLTRDVDGALSEARQGCAGNRGWGLDASNRRVGAGGLTVELSASADLESLTDGQSVQFAVRTNAPALVQVYSLSGDGRGWLAVPTDAAGGHRVVPSAPWEGIDTVVDATSPPRPEQLLVVAVPQGSSFTQTASWRGFCALPGTAGPELFPAGAAFAMVRFFVQPGEAPPEALPPSTVRECGTGRMVEYRP